MSEPYLFQSRRQFLTTSTALTFPAILGTQKSLGAAAGEVVGENDHFHYRRPSPDGPYIDSQRDHRAFAFTGDGHILLSEDCSQTWAQKTAFPNSKNITFSQFLANGNILFATRSKLYLSRDGLKTFAQIIPRDFDGSDYLAHTPKDPEKPGWYFHTLDGVHTWEIDGKEMMVWGNYCNVRGGSVPVNIYYTTDGGETVKLAYSFGQNPHYKDGETVLGNSDNEVICRHIHNVVYNPAEKAFYACTGDHDRGERKECHWLRGTYDAAGDSWDWEVKVSSSPNSRFKSGGVNFVDGQLYWAADANGRKRLNETYDRGIFRCAPADLADKSKHTRLYDLSYESANMIIEDNFMIASHCAPASPWKCDFALSHDLGKTWAQCDLEEFGKKSPLRFQKKNAEGWFRCDLRTGWIDRNEVLFIKPKS